MVKVKICGITSLEDAMTAINAGVDALGFVFHPASPRNISPETAARIIALLPPFIQCVGLFVDQKPDIVNRTADSCRLDIVQLHGDEPPEYCAEIERRIIKAIRVRGAWSLDIIGSYEVSAFLLDAWSPDMHGGTGMTFNWDIAAEASRRWRVILAGGLDPENVAGAVRMVKPYAVDVSSGVELSPGRKDPEKVIQFVKRAKELKI